MAMTAEEKKAAHKEYCRRWRAANKEKTIAYEHQRYDTHREYKQQWREANPDKLAKHRSKWAKANPVWVACHRRKWKEGNPAKVAEHQRLYQTKKRYPPELVEVKILQLKLLEAARA
jgi:hypothetical protein